MSSSYSYYHTTSTFYYYYYDIANDETAPSVPGSTITIPIRSPSPSDERPPRPTSSDESLPAAAVKIQSAFRRHLVRSLVGRIRTVAAGADRMEGLIQQQDTVDAVRRDPRERAHVNEDLMALLLRLDSVPGFYPPVRDLRRAVSRRIVALQEILDAIVAVPDDGGAGGDGFLAMSWKETVEPREQRAETEFDCWERFLLGI